MNYFVTGSTGFLGKYVVEQLLLNGHKVKANYRNNEKNIYKKQQILWIKKDLLKIDKNDLKNIDILINLASAGVSPKKTTLEEAININILGASKLLKIGASCGVKRFIYAGTCHEYGNSANKFDHIPPDAPLEPLNFYGATKASGFHLVNNISRNLELELVYARIFSAYGIGQNKNNFWPLLREAALSGKDFEMTSGKQIRDFIEAKEVAKYLLDSSRRNDVIKGKPLVINIGTGIPISLKEFALKEWHKFGAKGKLIFGSISDKTNEPIKFCPDISNLIYKNIL